MNVQFLVWFGVLVLMHLMLNMKYWSRQTKVMRRLFVLLYAAAIGLYAALLLGIKPPMPTQYFIKTVSPAVFSMIHPHQKAQREGES
ncbi:hypothetical protein ACP26L_33030 [Paenibacillus sp. S-38]|uniref:hypothetical protein n=1 Tax=Paenibacillus sp. S-38 TaxID=3416710 RepID=UPI003CEC0E13